MTGFVSVLRIGLHFPEVASLKGKRAELAPVKAHLHKVGAACSEVEHHDLWQRATLLAAVCDRHPARLDERADAIQGWLDARFPQGAVVERAVASWEDLGGIR